MTAKKKPQIKIKKRFVLGLLALGALPVILILFLAGWLFLTQRIYPSIKVAGVDVSLLTREQALQKVAAVLSERGAQILEYELNPPAGGPSILAKQKFIIELKKQETAPAAAQAVSEAFNLGRTKAYFPSSEVSVKISPSLPIKNQVENIAQSVNQNAVDSSLKIYEGEITVTPSQNGLILDEEKIYATIGDYFNGKGFLNPNLSLKIQEPGLNFQEATSIKKRLDEIKISPIKLVFEDHSFNLDLETILSLIDLENSKDSLIMTTVNGKKFNIASYSINGREVSDSKLTLNPEKLNAYLKTIAAKIDRKVQEPLFSVDPGSPPKEGRVTGVDPSSSPEKPKITEFRPPLDGRMLQAEEAASLINAALVNENQNSIKLPVTIVTPKNKLTNELGIKELIGRGVSHFTGSIENRKFNIGLAASRINGVLIAPNEEFSFLNTVGDISAATGFKQAYVIKSGRTVLDDGGGVCQVSTTVFRAALNSGLPITARTAHAYRVGYYEQGFPPGLDATIFGPSVDFKFKNDTPAHILIQSYVTGNTLTVDLYGTSDGRTVSMTKPVVTNITPAPPEIRQEDPSLPKGTVKQVDWAAKGANVAFSRTVTRGGVTYINETFKSNFRPWQAVYLVGTKEG
ncbi:VanW family protein [Candidatus Daviesbacteria bacterium]|nr:VanW family protein [Candidatus Daviesbacteria bacterium]